MKKLLFTLILIVLLSVDLRGSTDIYDVIYKMEQEQFKTNFSLVGTNFLLPLDFKEIKSLKVSFDFDEKFNIKEEPFFMNYERRYEIIFLVSIPTTYMVTKFLMEQVSVYNYKDFSRTLNTQQWAFVVLSSIIVPFIVATEDYIQYKKFIEEKLKF